MNSNETYIKQWEPQEDFSKGISENAYDELADLLCKEAQRGGLEWFDGTPVFDNDRHREEVQK